jgi:hypothetical protein
MIEAPIRTFLEPIKSTFFDLGPGLKVSSKASVSAKFRIIVR